MLYEDIPVVKNVVLDVNFVKLYVLLKQLPLRQNHVMMAQEELRVMILIWLSVFIVIYVKNLVL